jgi:hypothetical protein
MNSIRIVPKAPSRIPHLPNDFRPPGADCPRPDTGFTEASPSTFESGIGVASWPFSKRDA